MDEKYINDLLAAITEQRNAALNACAELQARIRSLEREHADKMPPSPPQ